MSISGLAMASSRFHPRLRGPLVGLLGLVVLLIGYVLSSGPTAVLAQRRTISWESYYRLYDPLFAISGKCSATENALRWYIQLWVPRETN